MRDLIAAASSRSAALRCGQILNQIHSRRPL